MKRRVITLAATIALCGAIIAGATLAYLSYTETKTNVMEYIGADPDGPGKDAAQIELREPDWSQDPQFQFTGATPVEPALGWGIEKADGFAPKTIMPKNPQIRFVGHEKLKVFVGIKVEGITGGLNLKQMEEIYDIDWAATSTTGWELVGTDTATGTKYFVYNTALSKGDTTPALFTRVKVENNVPANQAIWDLITADKASGKVATPHDLVIKGFSVQASNDEAGSAWDAKEALKAEFGVGGSNSDAGIWDWN